MRLKAPFYRLAIGLAAFLAPLLVLAAALPSFINAEPVKERFISELRSWTGAEVSLSGPIAIKRFFSLTLEAEQVAFDGFKGLPSLKSLKADRVWARVAWTDLFFGRLDFDKIKIYGASVALEPLDKQEDVEALLALLTAPGDTPFEAFVLSDSVVNIDRPEKSARPFDIERIVVTLGSDGEIDLGADFLSDGERISLDVETLGPGALPAGAKTAPVTASLRSSFVDIEFDGEAEIGSAWRAKGQLSADTPDLSALTKRLGYTVSLPPLRQVAFSGAIDVSGEDIRLERSSVSTAFGEVAGDLQIVANRSRPKVEGSLAFTNLDLSAFPELIEAARRKGDNGEPALSKHLNDVAVDLRASVNDMRWRDHGIGAAAFTMNGKGDLLTAELAHLDFLGGSVIGHIEADFRKADPAIKARMTAQGIDAARLVALAPEADWLTGLADAQLEGEAAGASWERLLASAKLAGRVDFPEGGHMRFDPVHTARFSGIATRTGWSNGDLSWQPFSELRFHLAMNRDTVRFDNLVLRNDAGLVRGTGAIDMGGRTFQCDLDVVRSEAEAGAASGSGSGESGNRREARLSIKGDWTQPEIRSGPVASLSPSGVKLEESGL